MHKEDIDDYSWEALFMRADTNHDNFLDRAEIVHMLGDEGLSHEELHDLLKHVFEEVDLDKNGLIDREEFRKSEEADAEVETGEDHTPDDADDMHHWNEDDEKYWEDKNAKHATADSASEDNDHEEAVPQKFRAGL